MTAAVDLREWETPAGDRRRLALAIGELDPAGVAEALAEGAVVIDGRSPEEYDACHVDGAVNVPLDGGAFASRARSAVDPGVSAVAVAGSNPESHAMARALQEAGFRRVSGIVAGGVAAYRAAGHPVGRQHAVPADRVLRDLESGGAVLVDAREDDDWVHGHVPGSLHVPLRSVAAAASILPQTPVVVACTDGRRAATAASILRRRGHANVWRVAGAGVPYLLNRRLDLGGL